MTEAEIRSDERKKVLDIILQKVDDFERVERQWQLANHTNVRFASIKKLHFPNNPHYNIKDTRP